MRVVHALGFLLIGGLLGVGGLQAVKGFQGASRSPSVVDIGFSQDMITHHQQALTMADLAMQHGGSEIRSLAKTIMISQAGEIGTMRGWLDLWNAPPAGTDPMRWMTHDSVPSTAGMWDMEASLMPGMASQSELNLLAQLSGQRFDIRFLQLMTRHHQGGLEMAAYANLHGHEPQVHALAGRMQLEEGQEVNLMVQLLRADHARPLPFTP